MNIIQIEGLNLLADGDELIVDENDKLIHVCDIEGMQVSDGNHLIRMLAVKIANRLYPHHNLPTS